MISRENIDRLSAGRGHILDSQGNKIGSVGQLYLDDNTETPSWVTVKTGLFGTAETFVPLQGATSEGDDVRVPYSKDEVKDAPRVEADGNLSIEEEDRLYRHYGLNGSGTSAGTGGYSGTSAGGGVGTTSGTGFADADRSDAGFDAPGREDYVATDPDTSVGGRGTVGHDTSGPTTDDAMTRSEERVDIGTERREAGRVRLRKYVVTENVTKTVPVSREEVRVEREPITDANVGDALSGPELSEEEHEVVLHEERPVVDKETVPVERVRLGKETVTDEETVTEEVRKERIDTDGDDLRNR